MIQVRDLVKRYGDFCAVDHLSFSVEEGEILGFLGPNGAGKSTTMNMITGYLSATEGDVIINGHNIYEEPELAKREIGYLPEIPPVYPDMRVKEYLAFAAELKGLPRSGRKEAVAAVMEAVKITHMQDKLIKHLSKGYRQRTGLAQALLGDPKVIILDEPTVGLDPAQIIEMRELIRRLAKGHTVILSSHILFEVNAVCDRILIINHGKKVVIDTPEAIVSMLGGTEGVHLCVKASEERAADVLSAIPEVEHFAKDEAEEKEASEPLVRFSVYAKPGADVREPLFYGFAAAGLPIYEMRPISRSLEEVFIAMTMEEKDAGNI